MLCIMKPWENQRGYTYSLALLSNGSTLSASLLLALALLEESLRDQDLVVGGDGAIFKLRLVRSPPYKMYGTERRCKNCS
jgi:hypothetical protein